MRLFIPHVVILLGTVLVLIPFFLFVPDLGLLFFVLVKAVVASRFAFFNSRVALLAFMPYIGV